MAPWCSSYHCCTTSFKKALTQVLCRFKSCLWRVRNSPWWESLTMNLAGNKAKYLSSVNHKNNSSSSSPSTRILPDMGFAMESQESKELLSDIVFRKRKWQNFQKQCKISYFGGLLAQIWAKINFPKISGCHFLASMVSKFLLINHLSSWFRL